MTTKPTRRRSAIGADKTVAALAARTYSRRLEAENKKLHMRVAELEASLFNSQSRIDALEKQLAKETKKQPINVQLVSYANATKGRNGDR